MKLPQTLQEKQELFAQMMELCEQVKKRNEARNEEIRELLDALEAQNKKRAEREYASVVLQLKSQITPVIALMQPI